MNFLALIHKKCFFSSIVTEDQYASNVPNNIRAEVAVAMDDNHLPLSPRQQSSAVAMVTRARGRTEDERGIMLNYA